MIRAGCLSQGKISGTQYAVGGIGGGLVVAGVSLVTARAGGEVIGAGVGAAIKSGTALGAASAAITDVTSQTAQIITDQRATYDPVQALGATGVGGATGAVLGGVGAKAAQIDAARAAAKREAVEIQARARELSIGRDDAPHGLQADPPTSGTGATTAPEAECRDTVLSGESAKVGIRALA